MATIEKPRQTQDALQELIDKEAIRELAMLYSRAVDRMDFELLRDVYTEDATDTHGDTYDGSIDGFIEFLEKALPTMIYSGHHICNHLVSVDGDEGNGEVYCTDWHYIPDPETPGNWLEEIMCVRYIDNYRRCADGKWRFSKRFVTYDMRVSNSVGADKLLPQFQPDPSYDVCKQRLFQKGPRA